MYDDHYGDMNYDGCMHGGISCKATGPLLNNSVISSLVLAL